MADIGETTPMVSILVPMLNEEGYIEQCLRSLLAQHYPADCLEIIVLDGESIDSSCELVQAISAEDSRVRLIINPGQRQAHALNLGIQLAVGDIIARADAHATYGPEYIETCVSHLVSGRADNVGGIQCSVALRPLARAIAAATGTWLGSGGASYRLGSDEPCYTDTVWLGCWYKKTLEEIGGFDASLLTNEDYECNIRLRKAGGRILLDPSLESAYYPRATLASLWRQYFRYGRGKVQTLRLHPDSIRLRQMIPPCFVAALLFAGVLAFFSTVPLILLCSAYLVIVLLASLLTALHNDWRLFLLYPVIYISLHLAWGSGFWWELLSQFFKRWR